MNEILLIGGGGHCESAIDVIEQENRFKIVGIIDKPELLGKKILNYEIIGNDSDLEKLSKKYRYAIITVGQIKSPSIRIKLFELAKQCGFSMPIIVSPRAYVSKYASIGHGTIVMHDALVNANASVGVNCIINTKSLVEHGCSIGNNCHISTASSINGGVKVEENCFIGSNATVVEYLVVVANSFIKAGSIIK